MIILLAIACGIFAMGFFAVLFKWRALKKDLRTTGKKLASIAVIDTNEQLTTRTFDRDISALTKTINEVLVRSRDEHIEVQRIESVLKRAITNISHDLRTPITSAKGFIQMLESVFAASDGESAAEGLYYTTNTVTTCKRYLSVVHGRLDALAILMDNLFAFTQAVEGNISLTRVNAGNVLRDALSGAYGALQMRNFAVESNIPDAPHFVEADEDALKRVVLNLISNAYTHGCDVLRISLEAGVITVANRVHDGAKIDTLQIFDRFYTADASRTHKHTGLGLAIARELAEKMGGTISAEITGEDFTIRVALRYTGDNTTR
ncbi:MAG: HAMP domain-containing histidine kinase [Defluviitaleaceae bacterium]|nr:HAMP domain-containing histidine kinase [Defluviitaleaceae bacterium]MCL2275428.1 HAMP domain-containing histidine kinase [Defluviitaleaceae bacterium]